MPRHDATASLKTLVTYPGKLVLAVLLAEINTLRAALSLPPRTEAQLRQAVRQYRHNHPPGEE